MADSILRLKVDSQEYDNKLKRAAEDVKRYAENCRAAGGTLEHLDENVEEFVRSIGQMGTVSQSAKGSINEMTKAFTELSVQYNKLTEEEKAAPFGKALNESLNTLKGRIQEGNAEIKEINDSLGGNGGGLKDTLDQIAGKFGLNIEQLTKFGSVIGVATTALKVAKDAFMTSETNVDDWGRTVASAESVYESFLQTLNTGDFSGFLSRLNDVINKAKEAYNALDELQTRMTIINPERTRLQARATELKAIIRREGANSEKGLAAQAELRELEGALSQAFKTESQLNMNAFKAEVDKKLSEAGIKLGKRDYEFLMRTFSSDASYMAMKRGARGSVGMEYEAGGSYDEGSVSKVDTRNINQKLLDLFTDEWRKNTSPLLNAAFAAKGGAASVLLSDARYLKNGTGGGGGTGGSGGGATVAEMTELQANQKLINELAQEYVDISDNATEEVKERQAAIRQEISELTKRNNVLKLYAEQAKGKLLGGEAMTEGLAASGFKGFASSFLDIGGIDLSAVNDQAEDLVQNGKEASQSWKNAASAIASVGSAMGNVKDPAAKIAGTIAQAIANIALAFSSADVKDGETGNVWYWIAATAAGMATMISTIATIHSATGYAQGGMIKGNSYSGDNIGGLVDGSHLVGLNAGEIVLNASMTNNLANSLKGNGLEHMKVVGKLQGTDIVLMVDRTLKKNGKELAVWG